MALSEPLDPDEFQELAGITSVAWSLMDQEEMAGYGSGEWLTRGLGPSLWQGDVTCAPLPFEEAHALRAKLNWLSSARTAYVYNPEQPGPASDRDGTALSGSTITINTIGANRDTVILEGFPAGFVITAGDLFHLDYGSYRRALMEFAEGGTCGGTGASPTLTLSKPLRAGITTGTEITMIKPAAKCKITKGSVKIGTSSRSTTLMDISFSVMQTLKAS